MSKYKPLGEYLARQAASPVTLTFSQIEGVLGASLPECAHGHRAWWANDKRPGRQAESWLSRGWRSGNINLERRRVTFRNDGSVSKYDPLGEHLAKQTASLITVAFSQMEDVLGFTLPPSAYRSPYWWWNSKSRVQAKSWLSCGWRAETVDLDARRATFRRISGAWLPQAMRRRERRQGPLFGAIYGMSKYGPLAEYFAKLTAPPVTLTFEEIAEVLGDALPQSAYRHLQWWENDEHPGRPPASWLSQGWRMETVDLGGRQVTFRRDSNAVLKTTRRRMQAFAAATSRLSKKAGKYSKLGDHLDEQTASPVTMTFQQIEKVLGFPLAPSAHGDRSWWSNGRNHANTWISRGWLTEKVDMDGGRLVFRRDNRAGPAKPRRRRRTIAANSWLNNKTGKYSKLGDHLDKQTASLITMTFKQIEKVLGFPLTPSAHRGRSWWSNGGSQAKTWVSRGWLTEKVSPSREQVTFRRGRKAHSRKR